MPDRTLPFGSVTYTAQGAHDGSGLRTWPGAPPATLTIRELNGTLHAAVDTGCNALTLAIKIDATHITPTDGVLMTGMYCPGPKGDQEHWLLSFFAGPIGYILNGPTLQLTAGDKTLHLRTLTAPETLG